MDLVIGGPGGGAASDYLSVLTSAEIAITTTATATISRQHLISGTSADYTVTLPVASGNTGKFLGVRISVAATKVFTIDGNGSETIDGALTRLMWAGESAMLYCDGSNWFKIAGRTIPMLCAASRSLSSQSITGATVTDIVMDGATDGFAAMYDAGNGRITIVRDGFYFCNAFAYCQDTLLADPTTVSVSAGGSFPAGYNQMATHTSSPNFSAGQFATIYRATVGNYFTTLVYNAHSFTVLGTVQPATIQVTEIPQW